MKERSAVAAFFILVLGLVMMTPAAQARAPIIYVHGMNDVADDYTRKFDLPALFRALGYDLYVAATPRYGTIEQRARVLVSEIERLVPEGPYHLLGHSMGGLDSRLALHSPVGTRCLSLTTLATPHHGARMADFVVHASDSPVGDILFIIKKIFSAPLETTRELTTDFVTRVFNANVPDIASVRYFSVAFAIPDPIEEHSRIPFASLMHQMAGDDHSGSIEPNDGLVTIRSAQWGRFLGTLTSDHWSETHPNQFQDGNTIEEIYGLVTHNLDQEFESLDNY